MSELHYTLSTHATGYPECGARVWTTGRLLPKWDFKRYVLSDEVRKNRELCEKCEGRISLEILAETEL